MKDRKVTMTEEELDYAIRCTKGTLAMEGLQIPTEIEEIYIKMARGRITIAQAEKKILDYHGIEKGEVNLGR